ncbi:15869_t:CDS:1 [Acaulospora morrowiae]|uniref:15869_t:CDS:1 n=1 Tax=Acaulospora morrowiae TaxID=94023 RepID=A0A9N9F9F6_9GLOM|nr:15869_t:CDS:1 [Acaulospora morrowiae]
MSLHGSNTPPSAIPEEILPDNLTSNDDMLLSEITTYFVDRGFKQNLVSSFLARNTRLEFKSNDEIMLDFLEEREQMDPTILIGIEGNEGVELGEDKKLLVKWGLTKEVANRIRDSVHDTIWSQRILKHWLLDWVYNLWDAIMQMRFDKVFYDPQFQRNQWHSYERKGDPQMFASSYEEIIDIGENSLLGCNTKVSNPADINYKAFFHATDYQSAQSISKNGIKLNYCRANLDFGSSTSFYLNPSLDNVIDFIKGREGFYGIVVYWADMEKVKSMVYRDLISDENLWREVVVASRCGQYSAVDRDDFVYGYQLSNVREILTAYGRPDDEDSWQDLIPRARWFEPIRHFQLAIKTYEAVRVMDSCYVGTIYFHSKENQ